MLASVEDMFLDTVGEVVVNSAADSSGLDDLGASPYDSEKVHGLKLYDVEKLV